MIKCVALKELYDEDWKTQSAHGYPNIPKDAEVPYIETITNFYGRYHKVRYLGHTYYVKPDDVIFRNVD